MKWSILVGSFILAVAFALSVSSPAHAACDASQLTRVALGESGIAVTRLQECLIGAGYTIPTGPTGYYGSQTQSAVQAFYRDALGLPAWDGTTVGPQGRTTLAARAGTHTMNQTTPAIGCTDPSIATATFGMSGASVRALQTCLVDSGYTIPAGITGYYGSQTQSAVQELYRKKLGQSWHGRTLTQAGIQALSGATQTKPNPVTKNPTIGYKRVSGSTELGAYIEAAFGTNGSVVGITQSRNLGMDDDTAGNVPAFDAPSAESQRASSPSRVSTTNVQVSGIDEPDIVKTDGEHIYVSRKGFFRGRDIPPIEPEVLIELGYPELLEIQERNTQIIDAFPLDELGIESETIEEVGEMLLLDDTLLIFAPTALIAYDVSEVRSPKKKWEKEFGENVMVESARLKGDTVYLVTATYLSRRSPCPAVPLQGAGMLLPCTDVWVPSVLEPLNTSYSVLALNPYTGLVKDSLTLAGERNNTVVSVFSDNLYITHRSVHSQTDVLVDFFTTELNDFLDTSEEARIRTIASYDISGNSKIEEIQRVVEGAAADMSEDEVLRFMNEVENRISDYLKKRARELDRSSVARISLATLDIEATTMIPGHLLNQFSMDEYEGYLRVAVTVGDRWGLVAEQMNDVYVLDSSLKTVGSITDLGLTEQIYAARFVGDTGYLVTFRETDPFYVLDLSAPSAPRMVGELKIPGFSSYLEPLSKSLVLGVGREGGNVKLSLFNVSDPSDPREEDTYILKEYWTEVQNNHRAFLHDPKHEVVFIPAKTGGHVFSYENDALSLEASVAGWAVKRAVYLDDYLYVIGENEITVLDETTWEEVGSLEL